MDFGTWFNLQVLANGWGFGGAILLVVLISLLRGWLVPGWMYKRALAAAEAAGKALEDALSTIKTLVDGQKLIDYVFENFIPKPKLSPKRGTVDRVREGTL